MRSVSSEKHSYLIMFHSEPYTFENALFFKNYSDIQLGDMRICVRGYEYMGGKCMYTFDGAKKF